MKRLLIAFSTFISIGLSAQSDTEVFKNEFLSLNKQGFAFSGAWSAGGLVFSGTEFLIMSYKDPKNNEAMARAQMNMAWSAINTGIFAFGYWQQKKLEKTQNIDWYEKQRKTKNLFLINTFLDVAYVGAGYLLSQSEKGDLSQNRGFGQAIMFQGSFLFAFDGIIWLKHRKLSRKAKN
jgi:cytochrome bd-type quinol oxidase subunit 2